MSKEKKIQCFIRRALVYSEGMDNDKKREKIVRENLEEALNLISCNSCTCECKNIFIGEIEK